MASVEKSVGALDGAVEGGVDEVVEVADHKNFDEKTGRHESYNDKFPEELKEEMLARVAAVTQLFRLRLVCKAWNRVITSPNLARLHATRHEESHQPWLLVVKHTERVTLRPQKSNASPLLYLCDPSRNMERWFAPPLPHWQATADQYFKNLPNELDLSICKSNGGLVCCMATSCTRPSHLSQAGRTCNTILIFNPVTRVYKVVPAPPRFDSSRGYDRRSVVQQVQEHNEFDDEEEPQNLDLALWRCKSTGHFKVAICNRAAREVRVFDSIKGLWREGMSPPAAGGSRPRFQGFRDRMCREKLYWYDVEKDAWIRTRLPRGGALRRPSVFKGEGDGSVMLAALLLAGRGVAGFGVWSAAGEADSYSLTSAWVPMSSTPPALLGLHRLKDSKLICHSHYVCLTGLLRFSICPWNCFYPCILTFSATQQTWNWLPHPLGRKTWAKFHAVSIFTPNLQSIIP